MELGYKIVGTFLLGSVLINYFMPVIGILMLGTQKENDEANMFWEIVGKINRKWYFFNGIIISLLIGLLAWISIVLWNWVFTIIAIPYFVILIFLMFNNIYKRIYAITDKEKLSFVLCIIFVLGLHILNFYKKSFLYENIYLTVIYFIFVLFSFILLFTKTKKVVKEEKINEV